MTQKVSLYLAILSHCLHLYLASESCFFCKILPFFKNHNSHLEKMGEQSVGKSFALNHLVDTSFAGSAMRTTGNYLSSLFSMWI